MANNVRIIPIHVEGYDEPVMPSNENISAAKNVRHPNKEEKQDVPEKQHQTTQQSQPRSTPVPPTQPQPSSETQQPTPPPQKLGPIEQIKSIQTSVLELMGEVERFNGKPKDKQYSYLDEMLTRNLLKLDNVETEGKDTIRQARKEAVKCIQQCLGILEAKAKANKELEDQLLEIDRLVGKISEPETTPEQSRPEESSGEKEASMEVDAENLEKTSDDVKTETEKNESVKETESKKCEEGMDTTSEVSNNLETISKEDKEASKV